MQPSNIRNPLLLATAMLLLTAFLGCQIFQRHETVYVEEFHTHQPAEVFISPHYHSLQPTRIILMIPRNRQNEYEVNTKFVDALRRNMSRLGTFDVVLNSGVCNVTLDAIRSGTFDERQLWEITRNYNADGILLCEVFSFSAYEPLKLGCTLTFVDTRESIVTLHTRGVWDAARENVFKKFRQFVCQTHHCKEYAAGAYLRSPRDFIDFVTLDLAEFLDARLGDAQPSIVPQQYPQR